MTSARPKSGGEYSPPETPCALEIERALLGAFILDNATLGAARAMGLDARDFYRPAHEAICRGVMELSEAGQGFDVVLLAAHLAAGGALEKAGGRLYLSELLDAVYTTTNLREHVKILREKSTRRRTIAAAFRLANTAHETETDIYTQLRDATGYFSRLEMRQWEIDDEPPEIRRARVFGNVSAILGIEVKGFIKYMGDIPIFKLLTAHGDVKVPENFLSYAGKGGVMELIFNATNQVLPRLKPHEWDNVARLLISVREELEIGPESTEAGALMQWLRSYFAAKKIAEAEDAEAAVRQRKPFLHNSLLCFFGTDFKRWLNTGEYGEKISLKKLGSLLREDAFNAEGVNVWVKDKAHRVWRFERPVAELVFIQ